MTAIAPKAQIRVDESTSVKVSSDKRYAFVNTRMREASIQESFSRKPTSGRPIRKIE